MPLTQLFRSQGAPVFFIGVWTGFALHLRNGLFNLLRRLSPPGGKAGSLRPAPLDELRFSDFEAIAAFRGGFQPWIDIAGVVMFAVAAQAQEPGQDHLRAATRSGLADRITHHPEAGGQVCSVHRMSFNAVAEAFLSKHIGGRFQPIGDDFRGSSIGVPTGADQVPELSAAIGKGK